MDLQIILIQIFVVFWPSFLFLSPLPAWGEYWLRYYCPWMWPRPRADTELDQRAADLERTAELLAIRLAEYERREEEYRRRLDRVRRLEMLIEQQLLEHEGR
ncbi:hypothetical protein BJX61DRAFT_539921 [Aspergillus egyptiacus]|nr:hypothetical protein BJX61DRAFT_539921 [Aspergillus egyptiacus]